MNKKMENAEVKRAIRVLKAKGVTIKQIEEVYKYYERLEQKSKPINEKDNAEIERLCLPW